MSFSNCWKSIWTFLGFFCLCYFLETITFTYLISTIQNIERQFQIPSRLSGTLVSAGDIGYVSFIVFLSYFGSKGNRARWIGGGCILIAVACLLISLPHFIFPHVDSNINHTEIAKEIIKDNPKLLKSLVFKPIKGLEDDEEKPKSSRYRREADPSAIPTEIKEEAQGISEFMRVVADKTGILLFDKDYGLGQEIVAPTTADVVDEDEDPTGTIYDDIDDGGYYTDPDTVSPTQPQPFDFMKILEGVNASAGLRQKIKNRLVMYTTSRVGFCQPLGNQLRIRVEEAKCEQGSSYNVGALALVFIGIMMIGIGHSMPWSLGVPLIDDSVKKKSTPLYFGGIFFIRIFGPVIGFVLGGGVNLLYVTLNAPEGMRPDNPNWIGAWWLGYIVVGAALMIPAILLYLTPKRKVHKSRVDEIQRKNDDGLLNGDMNGQMNGANTDNMETKTKKIGPGGLLGEAKAFVTALIDILKSPVYVGCLIGRLFDAFAFKGFFVFLPKFLESHYNVPQYKANMLLGLFGIIGFAFGIALGSVIMRKFKLEGRKAAAYVGCCSFLSFVIYCSKISLGCYSPVNQVGELGRAVEFNFTNECNRDCYCEPVRLLPVCNSTGHPFFSPCQAGCTGLSILSKKEFKITFHNCSCAGGGDASNEMCYDNCESPRNLYFGLMILSGVIGGTAVIPGVLIVLRSVKPEHRSVALGFSGFIVSLISTFPSPIVFGYVVDSSCLFWTKTCLGSGACEIYDPDALRWRTHLFHGLLRACALVFDIWVFYFAKNLRLMDDGPKKKNSIKLIENKDGMEIKDQPIIEATPTSTKLSIA